MRPTASTLVAALTAGALAACGTTSSTTSTQLALDNPTDISFGCFGAVRMTGGGRAGTIDDLIAGAAAPLADCDQWAIWDESNGKDAVGNPDTSKHDDTLQPLGQEDLSAVGGIRPQVQYYAFILQTVPGTVAIAHWTPKLPLGKDPITSSDVTLQDVDPLTPGSTSVSIGDLPVGIATDRNGCFEVTANAGTCDLSTLDITSVLTEGVHPIVNRIPVTNAAGQPVLAQAAAIAMEPPGGTIGGYPDPKNPGLYVACPETADGTPQPQGILWVAYPDCHRVAAIDVSTGQIKSSIAFDANGNATISDGNFTCPAQCGAGDPITAGTRPVSLSLVYDPRVGSRRLAIGAGDSNVVNVVDLGADYLPATTVTSVALDETDTGPIGISRIALSPQIGMGGDMGQIAEDGSDGGAEAGQFQFVYAVATDGTVRVADVLTEKNECDTEIDSRFLIPNTDPHYLSCIPVKDPNKPPRRAGAVGPGIRFINKSRPIAVTFVHALPSPLPTSPLPTAWVGWFAIVTSTSGQVWVVNVDDDNYPDTDGSATSVSHWVTLALPHQLRDRIKSRDTIAEAPDPNDTTKLVPVCNMDGTADPNATDLDQLGDGPHETPINGAAVAQALSGQFLADGKQTELPNIRQVLCTGTDVNKPVSELAFAAPVDVRKQAFPDLRAIRPDETWTMTWEGPLSNDSSTENIDGPIVREGQLAVDASGMHLTDPDHPYCGMGVEPRDEVVLDGCDPLQPGECGLGSTCYVDPNQTSAFGTCLPTSQVEALAGLCKEFLLSGRRYAAIEVKSGELKLAGRRHVLRTTPISGCTSDDQCHQLELVADGLPSAGVPVGHPPVPPTSCTKDMDCGGGDRTCDTTTGLCVHAWACEQDPSRFDPGDAASPKQCVMRCTTDDDCDANSVCDGGRCADGVIPPAQCVQELQRYEVHGSEAFVMIGQQSGYQHAIIADPATGACIRDPKASPLLIGRIPLRATPCLADGLEALSPNPCSTTVSQTELDTIYTYVPGIGGGPGSCVAQPDQQLVTRTAPAIRFRNLQMTFELVDPTYPGDKQCIGDRLGGLNDVPIVFPGYALQVRIVSGFLPYLLPLGAVVYPVNVVTGPGQSFWVIDDSDYLSATSASTRGAVYRLESVTTTTENVLE